MTRRSLHVRSSLVRGDKTHDRPSRAANRVLCCLLSSLVLCQGKSLLAHARPTPPPPCARLVLAFWHGCVRALIQLLIHMPGHSVTRGSMQTLVVHFFQSLVKSFTRKSRGLRPASFIHRCFGPLTRPFTLLRFALAPSHSFTRKPIRVCRILIHSPFL